MEMLKRWFKPNIAGAVVLVPLVALQLFFVTYSGTIQPGDPTFTKWTIGVPFPLISSTSDGGLTLHPAGLLTVLFMWCAAMRVGAAMQSSRNWRLDAGSSIRIIVVVSLSCGLVSLITAVAFSTHYWGYPWRRPSLPPGVERVRWTHGSGFRSDESGRHWRLDLEMRLNAAEPSDDTECCRIRRIVQLARSSGMNELGALSPAKLTQLEDQFSSLVVLGEGEPGYPYARQLLGIVLVGVDPSRGPVAFVSYSTLEHSNDHDALGEVWWSTEPVALLSASQVFADVAGIEGLTAPVAFASSFVVLAFIISPVLAMAFLFVRGTSRWLSGRAGG